MSLLLAACGGDDATAAPAFVDTFETANGMLYPPELWAAIGPSPSAQLLHAQTVGAIGRDAGPTPPAAELFDAVAEELDPLAAAALLVDAGVIDGPDAPWSAADVVAWWDQAVAAGSVDDMWRAFNVAQAAGLTPTADPAALAVIDDALIGHDLVPAHMATEILATIAPDHLPPTTSADPPSSLRSARDAAWLLHWAATEQVTHPSDVDPLARDMALDAVADDDVVMVLTVRAYVGVGDLDEATRIADRFDARRLLADGSVLEPPVFSGSAGSTFRMVRFLDADGRIASVADVDRERLVQASLAVVDVDTSHRLAGLAAAYLLDPDAVAGSDRTAAVTDALAEEVPNADEPLDIEAALAWLSIAEYASAMDVPLPFPGLTPAAIEAIEAEPLDVVAATLARLLVAIGRADGAEAPGVAAATDHLADFLEIADPATLDSLTLFTGAQAVDAIRGTSVISPSVLREQYELRLDGCLGGFDGFVRDTPQPLAVCNVESTRAAMELMARIEQN